MAEEKILVLQANTNDFIYKHFNGNFFIPRQEAIERIVKAFVNLYIEIEGTGITYTAKEAAEAALNALLEAENER